MPRLSLVDYARHRNVYPRAVEVAIQSGRIKRDADGLIDSEQADIDWGSNTSLYRSAASKANGQRGQTIRKALAAKPQEGAGKPAAPAPAPKAEPTDFGAYAKARAQREHYQAEKAKLDYEIRLGLYILRSEWEAAAEEFWKNIRTGLLAIPDRLCHELAADTDADHVRDMLDNELRTVMEQACESRDAAARKVANG